MWAFRQYCLQKVSNGFNFVCLFVCHGCTFSFFLSPFYIVASLGCVGGFICELFQKVSCLFPHDQSSVLDEPTADLFKDDVQFYLLIADCIMTFVFSVGAGMFVGSLIIAIMRTCRAKKAT